MTLNVSTVFLFSFIAYLLGSIPTAFIVVKLIRKKDIREIGSGNVGATNTYRAAGLFWAIFVFLIDMAKGFLPSWYICHTFVNGPFIYIPVIFLLIGHIYSIFLKFSGGKGAATGLGIFFALAPVATIFMLGIWVLTMFVFKIVSLSSIIAAASLPLTYFFLVGIDNTFYFTFICSLLVIVMHKNNIKRLLSGQEKRIKK
ncbi:MAG: acyl-phosphate glycerol 3-phosphate acyltransferase [Candidatus Muiribacterium halophilum]|mgnify:FL=1|uniref:Glycerol-3-phosphate acyltransferase n=1 Tax=Muiribacterium halophilum TaxID=2053465 RepID=A0A2N5ZJX9_MUIH1|nr:MAG: acyl-phosphate glycerol 3-phosphate acyltransferase [Candidatus Muirbacterium halophilum]